MTRDESNEDEPDKPTEPALLTNPKRKHDILYA